MPRNDLKVLIKEQKQNKNGSQSIGGSSLPGSNYTIFSSDEKKQEFKSALKQENRQA
jgi:hypothetical protein